MDLWILLPSFFLAALLYSSVGHGGASAYLAIMALNSVAPPSMRATALVLNVCVASIAFVQFALKNHIRWRALLWFALGGVPCAFLGARWHLDARALSSLIGMALLIAGLWMWRAPRIALQTKPMSSLPPLPAIPVGAALGFLAGLSGIGGGVFLSPLLVFWRRGTQQEIAAVAAGFIVLNSSVSLLSRPPNAALLLQPLPTILLCVAVGGLLGATWGARRASSVHIRRALALVLLIAASKLLYEAISA
jgi:uncharacterized protein